MVRHEVCRAVNDHLRRPEASPIDEALRLRLEGGVELLEDATALLDCVVALLESPELRADDLVTLREVISQLPRIEEALANAQRHEAAGSLVQVVVARQQQVAAAVKRVLRGEPPSLLEGLRSVQQQLRRQRVPIAAGETRFLEKPPQSLGPLLVLAAVGAIGGASIPDRPSPGWAVAAGLITFLLSYAVVRRSPDWVLLPERLVVRGASFWLSELEVFHPSTLWGASFTRLKVGAEQVELADTEALNPLVSLMRSEWFRGLRPRPTGKVVEVEGGLRLEATEGALTVRQEQTTRALQALGGGAVTLHQLFALLAHLPEGRVTRVAEQLEREAGAGWVR